MRGDTEVLRARVRAIPDKGKANSALTRLLAKTLGMPLNAVSVASGTTSRVKTLTLTVPETDRPEMQTRLEALGRMP